MDRYPLEGVDVGRIGSPQVALYLGYSVQWIIAIMREHQRKVSDPSQCARCYSTYPCEYVIKFEELCDLTAHPDLMKQHRLASGMRSLDGQN